MHENLALSFSIVTFNNSKIIRSTLESIINSIPENYTYTIYVIDNHSSDNTREVVRELEGNIEIIAQDINKGFGYGHNVILDRIDSDYHFVVNPDIIVENKEQIQKMICYLETNQDVGMLSPLILNPDMSVQYLCKRNPSVVDMMIRRISSRLFQKRQNWYMMKDTGYDKIMKIEYATGCFMVFRTDLFKQLRGFDDHFFMYLEDADITRRVNEISKAVFFPMARVVHAWQREGHKKLKYTLITIQSMFVYFRKWGWKFL